MYTLTEASHDRTSATGTVVGNGNAINAASGVTAGTPNVTDDVVALAGATGLDTLVALVNASSK